MSSDKIKRSIEGIENALLDSLWLDFDIVRFDGMNLIICGTIDRTYSPSLEIVFREVFAVCSPMAWTWDRKENPKPLEMLDGDESRAINIKYSIAVGYEVFRFNAEDFNDGCLIIAKSLDYKTARNKI